MLLFRRCYPRRTAKAANVVAPTYQRRNEAVSIPAIVYRDISHAVETAIQFGVTAEQFRTIVADNWDDELQAKRKRDAKAFTHSGDALPSEGSGWVPQRR